jgi:hypothetical protein
MDLVNAQISLLNDPSGNSAESGLARTLSMAVTGYFGEGGQIEQIRDLITGGFGTGLEFKQEDFDSKEDYDAAVDSAINYIGLAANSQPKDFVKNAIAYTNEVLLTYHIAKFNDDGGRLSNQHIINYCTIQNILLKFYLEEWMRLDSIMIYMIVRP